MADPSPIAVVELVLISEQKHWNFADRSSRELAIDILGALRFAGYLQEGL